MENRIFKFNGYVYIVRSREFADYEIVKARIAGVREFSTSYSRILYLLELPTGETLEALPCNMYSSLEELLKESTQHVVE